MFNENDLSSFNIVKDESIFRVYTLKQEYVGHIFWSKVEDSWKMHYFPNCRKVNTKEIDYYIKALNENT